MNFEEYRKKAKLYAEYAALVRSLIKEAMKTRRDLPKLQSSKHRGKDVKSLKTKLMDRGIFSSGSIEKEIKDLAGTRLIFYTNTDVDRFLASRVIPTTLEVDWDETKIHYPTDENENQQYQGIHYTVSLPERLAKQAKYKKFAGLRCEIQIQGALNNTWADIQHAVGYKAPRSPGFGKSARNAISGRMQKIMDDYLVPAGFDLQKVQKDYEHYMRGKTLYDQNPLAMLEKFSDNNQRHQLLSDFAEYVMPHIDDIQSMFPSILDGIEKAVQRARKTKTKPIVIGSVKFGGKNAKDVISAALEIIQDLRYVDVEKNFNALVGMYRDEPDAENKKLILDVVEKLAEYHLEVWKKAGPAAQETLANAIEKFSPAEIKALRPIILTIWRELLKPDMEASSSSYDKFTITSGALPVFDGLKTIRDRAIKGLFLLVDSAATAKEKGQAISGLWEATRMPGMATYSNDLLRVSLENTKQIADSLADRAADLPYEILESVEHHLLYDYRSAKGIAEAENDKFQCLQEAEALMKSIIRVRDKLDADVRYTRYKTLVGFNGVFPQEWTDEGFGFKEVADYRKNQSGLFIDEITGGRENEWFDLIQRCAETESEDLATFPIFGEFLINLSKAKPDFALRLLADEEAPIIRFLPAILTGLSESGAPNAYKKVIDGYIKRKARLFAIARHCGRIGKPAEKTIKRVLAAAITEGETAPAIEATAFAVKNHDLKKMPLIESIFIPALKFLTEKSEARWVWETYFLPEAKAFFESMSAGNANLILKNMLALPRIDHQAEKILQYIAASHPKLVLAFFKCRLDSKKEGDNTYEAFPFQFHGLEKELGKDVDLLINTLRQWRRNGDYMFQYTGARLLHASFPSFTAVLGDSLMKIVSKGADADYDFALALLSNYRGEPATHEVIKELIHRLPARGKKINKIDICLSNTGMVSGQYGFVEAYRAKIAELSTWRGDSRPKVKAYAEKHIRQLTQSIAREQRSADADLEIRKRDYGVENEGNSDSM